MKMKGYKRCCRHGLFPTLLIVFASMLFASCGESHEAKSQVKKFMAEQMALNDYDVIAWSNLDSTFHVKDSMLSVMQANAKKSGLVKRDAKYQPRTEKLNLITVKYVVEKDTLTTTFYLDNKMKGVVGVKKD